MICAYTVAPSRMQFNQGNAVKSYMVVLVYRTPPFLAFSPVFEWLGDRDSNPDKQSQSLLSYR